MTKQEVIREIERIEANFVITSISLGYLHNPEIRAIANGWLDPGSTVKFGRKRESSYKSYDVFSVYEMFYEKKENNIDYMVYPLLAMISYVHDLIKNNGLLNQTPEFEFFRHIRNGVSHGNRFNLRNNEPRRTATFLNFSIDSSLNGTHVVHGYMKTGDILDLIQYIKDNI